MLGLRDVKEFGFGFDTRMSITRGRDEQAGRLSKQTRGGEVGRRLLRKSMDMKKTEFEFRRVTPNV